MSKLVIIESPYAGNTEVNILYAKRCMQDSLSRGESPFASHLLYTTVLNDNNAQERSQGIEAGLNWANKADLTAVYTDRGITKGMEQGINHAKESGRSVEFRSIYTETLILRANNEQCQAVTKI